MQYFFLTVNNMKHLLVSAASEYYGYNQAVQITYADGLQNLAPQDDCDAAAALHSNYPGELTDGTACCTSMTLAISRWC